MIIIIVLIVTIVIILIIMIYSREGTKGPKEWGSQVTTGSIVLYSPFFEC